MPDPVQTPAEAMDDAAIDETNANARGRAAELRDPNEGTAVVGLGASAGGIAVSQQSFSNNDSDDRVTHDLHAEIDGLKRQLYEVSEQYKASSETLRASNEELITINNELKTNVEDLIKSNAELTNVMAATDIGAILLDRQLRINRFTPSAQEIFNLIPSDVGRPISDITNKLAYNGLKADAEKVLDELTPIEREVAKREGQWLLVRIAPFCTTGDRVAGIVVAFIDITRWKQAEGRVRKTAGVAQDVNEDRNRTEGIRGAEERFRLLVEGTPDYAMFLLDAENTITYWSSGAEKVFGWKAAEAVGQTGDLIFTPEDKKKGAIELELAVAFEHGYSPDRRWHVRNDGSRLWVDGIMRRLNRADGTLRGFAKIGRDATDLHKAEETLQIAHQQLEQRVHDRTRELQAMNETLEQEMAQRQTLERQILQVTERERARISQDLHDSLCQELTATAFLLKSRANAMKDESATQVLLEAAQTVNSNAGRARDLARGMHPPEIGSGGLVSALRELAARTNERVICRVVSPRVLSVTGDAMAVNLYRIAQEAVLNATKHAAATEIVICVAREGDEIVLSVQDDGKKRTKAGQGGLGVQMMKYRASVAGGSLTMTKKRGQGTKVTCRVPLKR